MVGMGIFSSWIYLTAENTENTKFKGSRRAVTVSGTGAPGAAEAAKVG
jgi:hypothetical protein